jgi:hypothetical protein
MPKSLVMTLIMALTNSAPLSDWITLGNPKSENIRNNARATERAVLSESGRKKTNREQTSTTMSRRFVLPISAGDVEISGIERNLIYLERIE